MTEQHDVIVVGAGPAGSATAYFLATQSVDALLVDKSDFPRGKTCGDALGPRALHFLDQICSTAPESQRSRGNIQ